MIASVSDAVNLPAEREFPLNNLEDLILKPNISIMLGKEFHYDVLRSVGADSTCNDIQFDVGKHS